MSTNIYQRSPKAVATASYALQSLFFKRLTTSDFPCGAVHSHVIPTGNSFDERPLRVNEAVTTYFRRNCSTEASVHFRTAS